MTEPNGLRYTMTVSFKRADNANIGFHVWQHALERPWHHLMNHATPAQLECLNSGARNEFWTELRCVSASYAGLNGICQSTFRRSLPHRTVQ